MSEREKGKYVDGKKKESNKITGGKQKEESGRGK